MVFCVHVCMYAWYLRRYVGYQGLGFGWGDSIWQFNTASPGMLAPLLLCGSKDTAIWDVRMCV